MLQPGDQLDGAYLALTPLSSVKAETQYLNTPPDLFRGAIDTDNKTIARGAPFTMEMRPATASIHITISGLSRATGTTDGNYTVEVSRTAAASTSKEPPEAPPSIRLRALSIPKKNTSSHPSVSSRLPMAKE